MLRDYISPQPTHLQINYTMDKSLHTYKLVPDDKSNEVILPNRVISLADPDLRRRMFNL